MNDLFKLNSIYKVNHLVEENKLSKIMCKLKYFKF